MVTRGVKYASLVVVGIWGLQGCGWNTLVDGQELADLRHGLYESLEWVLLLSQNCHLLDCCATDGEALDFGLCVPERAHGVFQAAILVGSEWLVNSISVSSGKGRPKLWLIHLMSWLEVLWLGQVEILFFIRLIKSSIACIYSAVADCGRVLFCVWFYHLQYFILVERTRVIVGELGWSVEVSGGIRRGFASRAIWTMLWMDRFLVLIFIDNRELSLTLGPTGLLLH